MSLMRMGAYICSVSSNFVFLDVVKGPLERYTPRRVFVILEEELERAGGDPDFRMIHREGGIFPIAKTFREDLHGEKELRWREGMNERVGKELTVAR